MSMSGHDLAASTAERYLAFAAEARGRSPEYEEVTTAVAGDALIRVPFGALYDPNGTQSLLSVDLPES
jgi:hypothetical protein